MTVGYVIDCRDETLNEISVWVSPEDAECGLTVTMGDIRIHLTSTQIDRIVEEWRLKEREVKSNLSKILLSCRETFDGKEKN